MKWQRTTMTIFINPTITKFLVVGLMNTVVGYAIYAILVLCGISYSAALLIATIAGVTFNYLSTGRLVFKSRGGMVVFGKFLTTYGLVYFVNAVGLELLIKHLQLNPYLGQALCVPPSVVLSWLLMNYWVYEND